MKAKIFNLSKCSLFCTIVTNKQKPTVRARYSALRKKGDYKIILTQPRESLITVGDVNPKHVDWGSRLTCTIKGKELRQTTKERSHNFQFTREEPTYWQIDPQKNPDLLDFLIARKVSANFIETIGSCM